MKPTRPPKSAANDPAAQRAARLKAALKANIAKRKAQARARDGGAARGAPEARSTEQGQD